MQTDFLSDDLPAWMRQPRRSADWGLLLAAALGLIAAWAFLLRDGVPAYNNLLHSAFMSADLTDALGEGRIMARWSPHVSGGFGAPIPGLIPQGAPILTALIARLLTGDIASAVRLLMTGALIMASLMQYLFCRYWIGPGGGLIAAALYVFSPSLGLTAPHLDGDMAGVVAMALLPLGLWAATRIRYASTRWDMPLAAAGFSALFYVHPILGGAGIGIGMALVMPGGLRPVRQFTLATGLAIALFAPFWAPMLAETDFVNWQAASPAPYVDITLAGLLTPVSAGDIALLNPPPQYTLGLFLPFLTLLGLAGSLLIRPAQRMPVSLVIAAVLAALGAVVIRQPWPVYILTLCCAALGGSALEWKTRLSPAFSRIVLPITLIVVLAGSSSVWLSPIGITANDFSPAKQIEYEQNGFGVAVLPAGTAIPYTTRPNLSAERVLIDSYQAPPLERVRKGAPARITPVLSGTHNSAWVVSTTAPVKITLLLAYFPGWEANLDGIPLTVEREPTTGLIQVTLPPTTNGTLQLTIGATPEETLGWAAALGALSIMWLWVQFNRVKEPKNISLLSPQELRLTSFALVFVGIGIVAAAMPGGIIDLRPSPFNSQQTTTPLVAQSDTIRLQSYKLGRTRLRAGETLDFALYWAAITPPQVNYGMRITITDIDRQTQTILGGISTPGRIPTRRWPAGYLVTDSYHLRLPDNLVPGTYQISIESFDCTGACNLNQPTRFRDSQGFARPSIILPTVIHVEK